MFRKLKPEIRYKLKNILSTKIHALIRGHFFYRLAPLIPIASTFLLWLAWPPNRFGLLIFVALVPQLVFVNLRLKPVVTLISLFFSIILWQSFSGHWILNATQIGGYLVFFLNSLLLLIPFAFLILFLKNYSSIIANFLFVTVYVLNEYLLGKWELAFPNFVLGASLSNFPELIQYYEYSGVYGGTLAVLLTNLAVTTWLSSPNKKKLPTVEITILIGVLSLMLYSYNRYCSYKEKSDPVSISVIHTNVNCRSEKFEMSGNHLVQKYLGISRSCSKNSDLIIWPETAITNFGWLNSPTKKRLKEAVFKDQNSNSEFSLISGAIMFETHKSFLNKKHQNNPNLIHDEKEDYYYYSYNGAFIFSNLETKYQYRTKEKLVPIEETIPNMPFMQALKKIVKSQSGKTFNKKKRTIKNFEIASKNIIVSPIICYESLFPNFVREFVKKGSNLMVIILNEGWYRNAYGANQFLSHSVIRSIENRRSIARSSNDGVSAFINQRGDIVKSYSKFNPQCLSLSLNKNSKKSFYTKHGDLIIILAAFLFFILLSSKLITSSMKH